MKVWLLASLIFVVLVVVLVSVTLGVVLYPEFIAPVAGILAIGAIVAFFANISIGIASAILGE